MRIKQISVSGLFGIFNHVIPLNTKERITIIHGLNGFGKTNILRILDGIFNYRYSVLKNIPFNTFTLEFDNNTTFEIVRKTHVIVQETHRGKKENKNIEITFNLYQPEFKEQFNSSENQNYYNYSFSISRDILQDKIISELEQINFKNWRYIPTGEIFSFDGVRDRLEDFAPTITIFEEEMKTTFWDEPFWVEDLKIQINICLIESQRLLNINFNNPSKLITGENLLLSTVLVYSEELAELMQNVKT